jgi:hypothetical protein
LKEHNNSQKKSEPTSKRAKTRGPMRRDTKEVLAELVGKLKEKLDPKKLVARSAGEKHKRGDASIRNRCTRCSTAVEKYGRTWCCYEPAMRWWRRGPS